MDAPYKRRCLYRRHTETQGKAGEDEAGTGGRLPEAQGHWALRELAEAGRVLL